jgi:hypothetical protein
MKNSYSLLTAALLIITQGIFAQNGDTLGVSPNSVPQFAPTNQVSIIPYSGGWCYGTNNDPNVFTKVAQGYINDDTASVIGVLTFIPKKSKGSNNVPNTKIVFSIANLIPNGAITFAGNPPVITEVRGPGAVLDSVEYFYDEVDTTFGSYNFAMFQTPVFVSAEMVVIADFSNFKTNGDQVAFMSDNVGNALGLDLAFHYATAQGANVWLPTNFVFQGALDNNVALFPVLKGEPSGVGIFNPSGPTVNGIKAQLFPNPAAESAQITIETSNADTYFVDIFSLKGQFLSTVNCGNKAVGQFTQDLNIEGLSSGTYIYSVRNSAGARYSKSFVIR